MRWRTYGNEIGTGLASVAPGFAVMVLLEIEKIVLRRAGRLAVPH